MKVLRYLGAIIMVLLAVSCEEKIEIVPNSFNDAIIEISTDGGTSWEGLYQNEERKLKEEVRLRLREPATGWSFSITFSTTLKGKKEGEEIVCRGQGLFTIVVTPHGGASFAYATIILQ